MTLSVDINHWLDEHGDLPRNNPRLRRNALRIVQFIEYGALLPVLHGRETLVQCRRRPNGKPCPMFLWVVKRRDGLLETYCHVCKDTEAVISGWQDTLWGDGPMEPVPMTDD
jgi:hypothetical protein